MWCYYLILGVSFFCNILLLYMLYKQKPIMYGASQFMSVIKLNTKHPQFDEFWITSNYEEWDQQEVYEIFALAVWNFIFDMYTYYGGNGIKQTIFWRTIVYWAYMHYEWLSNEKNKLNYSDNFFSFINDHARPLGPYYVHRL